MNNLERLFEINKEYSGQHVLKRKSLSFAVSVLELGELLRDKHKAFVIADQLVKAGTSVGANSSEADRGESVADFLHKLGIAQKEANESKYWIALCFAKGYISEKDYLVYWGEANEIYKIVTKSIITTKSNYNR